MNNNRNNRRRGRNNNRGQGGGNQLNRIDSRARGNAPQLLDKYKKMAQDAQHNGDRVQMEYYLQFADHYFRVIADNKARQDEARSRRDDDRDDNRERSGNDGNDGEGEDRSRSRRSRSRRNDGDTGEGEGGSEGTRYEPEDNPFTRENEAQGETRKPRRSRKRADAENASGDAGEGIDAAALPPAIGGEEAEAPRKRTTRRRKPDSDNGDETLSAVG